jgi:hypothetical protein
MGFHNASVTTRGVTLAVIPFGASQAPYFDGALGSFLTIADDPQYSQPFANALTIAAWICPLALDNANTTGTEDRYVHFVEKAVGPSNDVEWVRRLYNQTNPAGIRGFPFTPSTWARLRARGTVPTWSMAFLSTTRRRSSSASGCL